jgi:hypothetical protein
VPEIGRGLDLAQRPFVPERSCELRPEDLDRHLAAVLQVVRKKHNRHAAFTELSLEAVATFEGSVKANDEIGHGVQDGPKRLLVLREPLRAVGFLSYRGPGGRCVSRYRTMSMRMCSDVPSPSRRPWSRLG